MRKTALFILLFVVGAGLALSGLSCEQRPKRRPVSKQSRQAAVQPKQQTKPAVESSKSKQQDRQKKGNRGVSIKRGDRAPVCI